MPLGVDNLDGEQLRQAAKLLERENERLIRQVLELKQQLATAEGKGSGQLELLAELERQLDRPESKAVRGFEREARLPKG